MTTPVKGDYAMGWLIHPTEKNRWHNGRLPGTRSWMILTSKGIGCMIVINSDAPDVGDLDKLGWEIINGTPKWPSYDLF
jgi:hypothetical protein